MACLEFELDVRLLCSVYRAQIFCLLDVQQLKTFYGEPFTGLRIKLYFKRYLTSAVYNLLYRVHEYLSTVLHSSMLDSNMYPLSFVSCF